VPKAAPTYGNSGIAANLAALRFFPPDEEPRRYSIRIGAS